MANQRVLLTINKELHDEIVKSAKSNFMNIQEFINDILRKEILKQRKK